MIKRLGVVLLCAAALCAQAEDQEWRPPFITTPPEVVERMLAIAGTHAGDLVVDLGSGDGRIVIAAAQKYGARGLGIELDGILVEKSLASVRAAGLADRVQVLQGDVLTADISQASVVTVYLLPDLMRHLQPRFIDELAPGTRIVSHAFGMAGWAPDRTETVAVTRSHVGQGNESRIHFWVVPAEVRGRWRGGGLDVRIEQNFQQIDVEGAARASLSGRDIAWQGARGAFKGRVVEKNRIAGELDGRPVELKRAR